jgi:sulfite reductase alpha subunit-like flavoprotein
MQCEPYDFLILYASQTGTSKYAGEELSREANRRGLTAPVRSLAEYDIENLPEEKYVIFLISTTGFLFIISFLGVRKAVPVKHCLLTRSR